MEQEYLAAILYDNGEIRVSSTDKVPPSKYEEAFMRKTFLDKREQDPGIRAVVKRRIIQCQ